MTMSNYPEWWDTTITIYNRFEDPVTNLITWNRNVISNCFWKDAGIKLNIGQTIIETNDIICRIPENKKFREYYKWVQLPNDNKSKYFTLGVGDIIVRGKVTDIIDEYTSQKRSNDLIGKYKKLQGCMQIENVAINVGSGRCNPHYYVKGI